MAQELKAFGIRGEENGRLYFAEVYTKRDVDAVLAEKDAFIKTIGEGQADLAREIERLKAENERLNHALWLARAERALEKIAWFKLWNASISTMNPEDGARQEFDKWKKALGKFLAKAEEFK